MNRGHSVANVKNLRVSAVALLLCAIVSDVCLATRSQEIPGAVKFDAFEEMMTDNILARLDLFAQQLGKDERVSAFIVAYRREDQLPGPFLRDIYGYRNYLVNMRGVDPDRTIVIDGGIGEKRVTELWLVPNGASFPKSPPTDLEVNAPTQFDGFPLEPVCMDEFTLVLQQPSDALRFFAGALRSSPTAKGFIIVHPSVRQAFSKAEKIASGSKQALIREYGISAERISTGLAARRSCTEMNLWLTQPNLGVPKTANVELFFQSQLIAEAEQKQYTLRRFEVFGNENIPDRVLRRRLRALQEGDIFSKALLTKGLASLSRLGNIKPVGLEDVEVHLNRTEKLIDLIIVISERPRRRAS